MAPHVWSLRSERSFRVIHGALDAARARPGFGVTEYAIQGNHVHLIAEADGPAALANGMRSLTSRIGHRLNALMGRRGRAFEDRYHVHVLRTPAEVRSARSYVLGNFASHARRRGEPVREGFVDRYSSAVVRSPRAGQLGLWPVAVTSEARSWLGRVGERARGAG